MTHRLVPEMAHDKVLVLPAGFERLNEPSHSTRGAIADRVIYGDGNVEKWSASSLNNVATLSRVMGCGDENIGDAVYVVGTLRADVVKVGFAADPLARLIQLQCGNHERLFLHRVFFSRNYDNVPYIEKLAHKFLEKKCKRHVGEWFECSPVVAHDTVTNAFRSAVSAFWAITPHTGKEIKVDRII